MAVSFVRTGGVVNPGIPRKAVKRLTVLRGIGVVGCTLSYRAVLNFLGLFDATGFLVRAFLRGIIKKLLHFSFKRVIIVA